MERVERAGEAITLAGVSKSFDDKVAVRELSLAVPAGSVYGLLGPNGAGKTTTLRLVLGILEADAGEISILGGPVSQSRTDRIGYLPEERGLYHRMRAAEVLTYLAELKGVPARVSGPRIREWLERFQLGEWSKARVHQLSKGMQQKLQFISAILHEPEIVILDEPFSGLDPINQGLLKEIIHELRRKGCTILFSTHMIEHAERLCDHVCILSRGRAVVNGPLSQVRRSHGGRYLALGFVHWDAEDVEQLERLDEVLHVRRHGNEAEVALREDAEPRAVLGRLLARGLDVRRFEVVEPSLEQIFLEHVGVAAEERAEGVRETGGV